MIPRPIIGAKKGARIIHTVEAIWSMQNIYTRTFVPSWFARKGGNTSGWVRGGKGRFISTVSTRRTLFHEFLEKARYAIRDPRRFRNKLACGATPWLFTAPSFHVNSGIDSPLSFSTASWRHLTHEILHLEIGSLLDFNYCWEESGGFGL